MTIRTATQKDLISILEIFNYEVIHTSNVYIHKPWTLAEITNWYLKKEESDFPFLVAEIENKVVGYAYYGKFREREAYDTTVEYSVYIHKDFRRNGIAYKLVSNLIEIARKKGIHSIIGGLDSENKKSIKFHESLGFTKVAYIKSVARKFDKWLDLIFFQLLLDRE